MGVNKIELNVEKTTYNQDYQVLTLKRPLRYHEWTNVKPTKPEEKCTEPKLDSVKYVYTMRPWRKKIPFDTLWQTEPIIRTNPWQMTFEKIPKVEDPNKNESIKTRPRVTMSPAISMDDITDPQIRSQLCNYVYKSECTAASSEINFKSSLREIPNTTLEKNSDPVRYKGSIYKPLPPGWKQKGIGWERKQHTSLVDPTKAFWLNYQHTMNTPAGCDPFGKMITNATRREIRELIGKDELRLTYDKSIPGYTGYKPRFVTGQLRKQELEMTNI